VMRIAAPAEEPPSTCHRCARSLARANTSMVRLPFARSTPSPGFRPGRRQVARFSEPEGVRPTSANRRCTGTGRGAPSFLVLQGEVTNLFSPLPACRPLAGATPADEPREVSS
jgi:hypothetical protein